jgi:hypothetical protein
MRCSICLGANGDLARVCGSCGARLEAAKHRELSGITYLLGEVGKWENERRIGPVPLAVLRQEYGERRDALKRDLLPAKPPPKPAEPVERAVPPPEPVRKTSHSGFPIPAEPVRPVAPARAAPPPPRPPAPPRPPFAWRNLCTERNIRWVLNLGIFIFSVALAVFIHTQWRGMAPGLKIAILFGASFAAMGAGHLLRRTILKATGMALVILGALAVPIDCAAVVEFGILDRSRADQAGLAGAVLSLAVYVGLAHLYKEGLFHSLAALAAGAVWAFLLRQFGVEWPVVVPWLVPLAAAGFLWGPARARKTAAWGLGASLAAGTVLVASGVLDVRAHGLPLEIALESTLAATVLVGRRTSHPLCPWAAMVVLWAMFGVATGYAGLAFPDCWLSTALLGAAFGAGWRWRSAPFIMASVVAGLLSLAAAGPDLEKVAIVLAVPAALHAALGWARKEGGHAAAGWLLAGGALAVGLNALHVGRLWQPLAFAAYGAAMAGLSRLRTKEVFHALAVAGGGAAMLLLALWYMEYFLPAKRFGGGQASQVLGASIALAAAFAFGPVAHAQRSRLVSDITYGCIGFAYILALRWAQVPPRWLGLSVALFGVAYFLLEKRISRWLLRPTLFTGIASTIAAGTFALLQWLVFREYPQSSLTLLLVGGFYLAVARFTPYKWLAHVGTYAAAAGWLVGLEALDVPVHARALLTLLPAAGALVGSDRRRDLHLGLANLVVAAACLGFVTLDPSMYERPRLPFTIAASALAALLAGWFAFRKPEVEGVDARLMSGLMGAFASAAYLLLLRYLSTGSPWGGLVIFAMSAALGGAAEALRRSGLEKQSGPLALVSLLVTGLAILQGHLKGSDEGVHLAVYGMAWALYTLLGRSFAGPLFPWAGAAAGAAGLVFWLLYWDWPWIGVATLPLAALALRREDHPVAAVGWLAAALCPLHAATRLHEVPAAGLVFAALSIPLALTLLRPVSFLTILLAVVISWGHEPFNSLVAFSGFALHLGLALARRHPVHLYLSLALALLGDYHLAMRFEAAGGLVAFPLALVLFGMAYELRKRLGEEFGWPLLGASFAAAILGTLIAFGDPTHRILLFLGDALLFGAAAALFRRPELVYPCSAALVGLDLALMAKFRMESTRVAFQLLTLSLAKVILVRAMGERLKSYLQPVFVASLVIAAGVLAFGLYRHEAYTGEDIDLAIWGLILLALIVGVAGRIRKVPAMLYLSAGHLLGAYYLALHKHQVEPLEFYSVPIGAGLVVWSVLALREKGLRGLIEGLAVAVLFLPSAVQSFVPGKNAHTLAALGFAFAAILAGMGLKRRVLVLGATGAFVGEGLGKALHFLVEQELSAAEWGMIVGGMLILTAAAFEARKAKRVQEPLEALRARAGKYFAALE